MAKPFTDIGYKYPAIPQNLTMRECSDFVFSIKFPFYEKDDEEYTEQDGRDLGNTNARVQIFEFLDKIPRHEWTEEHHKLLAYGLSDLDFYSSERQFQEVCDQCLRCK